MTAFKSPDLFFDPCNLSIVHRLVQTLHSPVFLECVQTQGLQYSCGLISCWGIWKEPHKRHLATVPWNVTNIRHWWAKQMKEHGKDGCAIFWKTPGIQQIAAATSNKLTDKSKCIVYCCQTTAQHWSIWLEGQKTALTGQQVLRRESYLVVTTFIGKKLPSLLKCLKLLTFPFPCCTLPFTAESASEDAAALLWRRGPERRHTVVPYVSRFFLSAPNCSLWLHFTHS